jgi:hypothetical protein
MHDKKEQEYEITQSLGLLDGELVQQGFESKDKLAFGNLLEI